MYFVFVILVVLVYCLIQYSHLKEEKKRKRFCFCAFLVILFVHFFKDNSIYPDLIRYEMEFDGIADIKNLKGFFAQYFRYGGYFHEFGWSLFNFFCTRFTNDFSIFLKIVSIGICKLSNKNFLSKRFSFISLILL